MNVDLANFEYISTLAFIILVSVSMFCLCVCVCAHVHVCAIEFIWISKAHFQKSVLSTKTSGDQIQVTCATSALSIIASPQENLLFFDYFLHEYVVFISYSFLPLPKGGDLCQFPPLHIPLTKSCPLFLLLPLLHTHDIHIMYLGLGLNTSTWAANPSRSSSIKKTYSLSAAIDCSELFT